MEIVYKIEILMIKELDYFLIKLKNKNSVKVHLHIIIQIILLRVNKNKMDVIFKQIKQVYQD